MNRSDTVVVEASAIVGVIFPLLCCAIALQRGSCLSIGDLLYTH